MSKREGAIKDLKESLKADSERIIKIVRLEAELKAKNEALNRAMGRITALSLKDGRVTMANLYEQLKELQTENEKMADSFLGRGTQLIGDMRYQELLKAEAENKDLKEARKKPEPTDEGCTNCKNLLEAEITRQAAELAQLKRALRYPEPDDSERQYMFCGYCGKEGAMTIDELQQHILSCEKHPIFKLQAELEAKDKEIDRLKRVIELDEQIEQALKK